MRRRALLTLLALPACAGPPAEWTSRPAPEGFAVLHRDEGGAPGARVGSAVAVAPGRVASAAHLLPKGAARAWLRTPDGGWSRASVLARPEGLDLILLSEGSGALRPLAAGAETPRSGEAVWAFGAPSAGPTAVSGTVEIPDALMPGYGRGFTARLGALAGYSGGPVTDGAGRLRGLVCAVPEAGASRALAAATGLDLGGLARGGARRVFVLSVRPVLEALRAAET